MKNNFKYKERLIDKTIQTFLKCFGAIQIVGPKWCGKTTTAKNVCNSFVALDNSEQINSFTTAIAINPEILLDGQKPKLLDEWHNIPSIWDVVRHYCDENKGWGHFILTGSTSIKVNTVHSGIGRIATIEMYPMSLFESNESNGIVSLKKLFDKDKTIPNTFASKTTFKQIVFAACRGGWPNTLDIKDDNSKLLVAKQYYKQIYSIDIPNIEKTKRNNSLVKDLLKSYARNISTLAKNSTIINDVQSNNDVSGNTITSYIDSLEKLYVIKDLYGWCPSIRSKSTIRSGKKREFIDPSIAVAALGLSPAMLEKDLNTLGFIFENLCIRDLRVYSESLGGDISYYHDRYGLECDCVLHLDDGRYALIEIKLGPNQFEQAVQNLEKIESLIIKHNSSNKKQIRLPDLKIILTSWQYGGKIKDKDIWIIPITCLRD